MPSIVTRHPSASAPNNEVASNVGDVMPTAPMSGCAEDPNGGPTCSLDSIAAGGSASYTIEVTVGDNTFGTITNSVSVSSETLDREWDND